MEQFGKCFISCCKLSIAMTKSELFWCMHVLANQKVDKTRKPLYGKEVAWNWPKSSWFNLVFLQLFSFHKTISMSFYPLPCNLCIVRSTLSFNGIYTLVNVVIVDAIRIDLVSWGRHDSCNSGKGWFLLQLVPNEHVSPFSCKSF